MRHFSCLMVLLSFFLFPLSASAYVRPIPIGIEPITETPLGGTLCRIACRIYGDSGQYFCLTPAEQLDIENDPNCWIPQPTGGPCKKCSSNDYRLTEVNRVETCLHLSPCPKHEMPGYDPYTYGNYKGKDACYLCPTNYDFLYGDCQWFLAGELPAQLIPRAPSNVKVSQGTSPLHIIVTWSDSDLWTSHYIIERASYWHAPTPVPALDRHILAEVDGGDFLYGEKIEYYDKSRMHPPDVSGAFFCYWVKACYADNTCGEYSLSACGHLGDQFDSAPIYILLLRRWSAPWSNTKD